MKYIATRTFQIGIENNAKLVMIHEGIDIVDGNHEFYLRYPDNWKPLTGQLDVEQATAAPGEKRGVRMREVETPEEPAPDEPAPDDEGGDEE